MNPATTPTAKRSWDVIGTMSGTSMDGLDICCTRFTQSDNGWTFAIRFAETIPYPAELLSKLKKVVLSDPAEIDALDVELSTYIGQLVRAFAEKHDLKNVSLLGSHGHTVFHEPDKGITRQIGNTPHLRYESGIPTICDFRVQDVRLGGQGAPLVPIGDQLLFSDFDICLNLGGFANLSAELNDRRIAWDVCPVNMGLNHFTAQLGLSFDAEGRLAMETSPDQYSLTQLRSLAYYSEAYPKSLGKEWFDREVIPLVSHLDARTAISTLTHHAAERITADLTLAGNGRVICTGGGTWNTYLISLIRQQSEAEIIIPEPMIVEFKEAMIFGFLALLRNLNIDNVLASVTGAEKDHSSGVIYP